MSRPEATWRRSASRCGRVTLLAACLVAIGPMRGRAIAAPGVLEFGPQFYTSAASESGVVSAVVIRTGGTDGTLSAQVVFVGGSATAGQDYVFTGATVTFADGDANPQLVSLTVLNDADVEPAETAVLDLVNPGDGTSFGRARPAVVTILSDDAQNPEPQVTLYVTAPLFASESPLVTYPASRPTMPVSGTVQTGPSNSFLSLSWRSDRGFSGTATYTPGVEYRSIPSWETEEIPLLPGANTLTFTALTRELGQAFVVVVAMVSEYDYVLGEGATGSFFDTDIVVANPGETPAPTLVTFLGADGRTVQFEDTIAPGTRKRYQTDGIPGLDVADGFSTSVASTNAVPLAVERISRWGSGRAGAHASTPGAAVSKYWYFAEGAQGYFQTYLLLTNLDPTPNAAYVDWWREGGTFVSTSYTLPPHSRTTIFAGGIPELVNQAFGITVRFLRLGVAERSMYFGDGQTPFVGGHSSAGMTQLSRTWYLSEGATGSFFDTFLLLFNRGPLPAEGTMTLFTTGAPLTVRLVIPAGRRVTLNLEPLALGAGGFSTYIAVDHPIVVERSQYWGGPPYYEGHNNSGVISAGRKWGLAEGRVGGSEAWQTFILLMNPQSNDASVSMTFFLDNGSRVFRTFTVPAGRRFNVNLLGAGAGSDVPEVAETGFSALVLSDQPIVVERAIYGANADGRPFASGTAATAARLP
jgi:Calx-beta domain